MCDVREAEILPVCARSAGNPTNEEARDSTSTLSKRQRGSYDPQFLGGESAGFGDNNV